MTIQVSGKLTELCNRIREDMAGQRNGMACAAAIPWAHLNGALTSTRTVDQVSEATSRTALADAYAELDSENGSSAAAQLLVAENDWLASHERDLRLRNRSRIRLIAHEVGRRKVFGHVDGPINRVVLQSFKAMAARQSPESVEES